MNIPSKIKPLLYGLGVFIIYAILTYVLRLTFNRMPVDGEYLGVYSGNDLLIGIAVAFILTLSHERKKKLK